MERELRHLHTYFGRVDRDVGRKVAGDDILQAGFSCLQAGFSCLLGLLGCLSSQQPKDKNTLHSLYAPAMFAAK